MARAFGPHAGWLTGWAIVGADMIVMAALAQIAGIYGYLLVGPRTRWRRTRPRSPPPAVLWILIMTWISYRGIELSARTQYFLLGAELIILGVFAVVALAKVYGGTAGELSITPALEWFNPTGLTFSALSAGFLLAVFIYWGWDSAVAANEETTDPAVNPGRAAVRSTVVLGRDVPVGHRCRAGLRRRGRGGHRPDQPGALRRRALQRRRGGARRAGA